MKKRKNLESKNKIIIYYLKENMDEIKYYGNMILVGASILVGYGLYQKSINTEHNHYKYIFSTVSSESSSYFVKDLYLVHTNDNTLICNKVLDKSDEYVYVDIKTGNIIYKDKDTFIEKLSDIELQEAFKSYNYQMSIDEITYYLSQNNQKKL